MKNSLIKPGNVEMDNYDNISHLKHFITQKIPVSVFCKYRSLKQVISNLENVLDENIKVIDFNNISDFKELQHILSVSSDSIVNIFINIESISKIKDYEIIRQSLYALVDNEKYTYNMNEIDFPSFKKVCIYDNENFTNNTIRLDWLHRKTFIINL